jgi:predicted kinase
MDLILMRGASCSGKSTIASQLVPNKVIISSDATRELLFGDITIQTMNKLVFEHIHKIVEHRCSFMVGVTLVDATHLSVSEIAFYVEMTKKYGTNVRVVSIVPPSIETLIERNTLRSIQTGVYIPPAIIEKHHRKYFDCRPTFVKYARDGLIDFHEIGGESDVVEQ